MALNLFKDIVELNKQHPLYIMMKDDCYAPERAVLEDWAEGFTDRDGKFCREFQTSFEPCFWELYLYAYLKEIGAEISLLKRPDFAVKTDIPFVIEATIAAPPMNCHPPYGSDRPLSLLIPSDLNRFNSHAILRLCNSFITKFKKYRESYACLPHSSNQPFVIAIASFDQPGSHFSAMRPIMCALYGIYYDEEMTIALNAKDIINYKVAAIKKNEKTNIDLGYFCTNKYSDVSAVIFSSLATWGKVRALANNKLANSVYYTLHANPNADSQPIQRIRKKADYNEHLLDGLYVMHNPFAKRPLNSTTLAHDRIAQIFALPDGGFNILAPDDFLLIRTICTF